MRNLKRVLLALVILAVAAVVLLFVLENQQSVALVLFGWAAPALPLSVVVLFALVGGLLVGPLMGVYIGLRAKNRERHISQ
ncbi:MAG: lipopolysaccharide assembly protein LapA domain-containing protein [Pseudomonas palmensis]|uniref:lipopolysaccharide assembly protein LapA domain-containing protein n=1 Tax=Pseudomonas palmensis TaxID=2815362 RepID=UPI003D1195F5